MPRHFFITCFLHAKGEGSHNLHTHPTQLEKERGRNFLGRKAGREKKRRKNGQGHEGRAALGRHFEKGLGGGREAGQAPGLLPLCVISVM